MPLGAWNADPISLSRLRAQSAWICVLLMGHRWRWALDRKTQIISFLSACAACVHFDKFSTGICVPCQVLPPICVRSLRSSVSYPLLLHSARAACVYFDRPFDCAQEGPFDWPFDWLTRGLTTGLSTGICVLLSSPLCPPVSRVLEAVH